MIFGAFVTSIDMNSGAPTFGTPEASHITYGAGQLARRLGLPYRSGAAFCGSKLPDAQAAYESANSLNMALLSGVNFMLHACGWLEGGLVSSYEKFVMDADQLGTLHHLAKGIIMDENGQGMDAIREVAHSISRVNEVAAAIASATEEQGAVTREIAMSVQSVASQNQRASLAMRTICPRSTWSRRYWCCRRL